MSQEVLRGGDGSAAANKLRGLRKANRTSVVTDMVADDPVAPVAIASAPVTPAVRLQSATTESLPAPEPVAQPAPVVQESVAQPVPVVPEVVPVAEVPHIEVVVPTKGTATPPAAPAEEPKIKTGIFQTKEEHARLRATFSATRHLTGFRTMSEYVEAAISQMNTQIEEQFNGGEPYPTGLNQVTPGRPLKF